VVQPQVSAGRGSAAKSSKENPMKPRTFLSTCAFILLIAGAAAAQPLDTSKPAPAASAPLANSSSEIWVSGKVVSATSTELVIDTDSGQYMTFALDSATTRATSFTAGERVRVNYHSSSGGTVNRAASIAIEPPTEVEPQDDVTTSTSERLPETASVLPLILLLGLLALSGAVAVRIARS
jgi:hypothetical protein